MSRPLRPANGATLDMIDDAIALLREAREWLGAADCPRAQKAVVRALKSAEGARRHAERRGRTMEQRQRSAAEWVEVQS